MEKKASCKEVSSLDYKGFNGPGKKNTMQLHTSRNTVVKYMVHTRTRVTSAECNTSAISRF